MELQIIVNYPDETISVLDDNEKIIFCESRDEDLIDEFAHEMKNLLEWLENSVRVSYIEHEEDMDMICNVCNGSGEGKYEGTSCYACRGSGSHTEEGF